MQQLRKTAKIATRADGTLKLAVVADTHSEPHGETLRLVRALAPDGILHAGDIGDLAVIAALEQIAPVYVVRGNIDTHAAALPDALVLDIGDALRILIVHIGVAGPRLRGEVAKQARAEQAQLVVCGHSHVPFIGQERGLSVFNPGSCGPRRFALPIVFGTIEVSPRGVRMAHLDCETGRTWLPPL